MNKFIYHVLKKKKKKAKYPFIIANTGASSKSGTHWWSILDIEPKANIFFFDSFGIDVLKNFIMQDDRTEQMTRTKLTLVNIKFNLSACKNLTKKELDAVSDTAMNSVHFVQAFSNKLKLRDFGNVLQDKPNNLK